MDQGRRQASLDRQVAFDPPKILGVGSRELELRARAKQAGRGGRIGKVMFQPFQRLSKPALVQMDHQVDGPAAAEATSPIHELGSGDGEDSL